MKRAACLLAVAGLVGVLVHQWLADAEGQVPANWFLDYGEAKAQARKTGKPIFVVFH